MTNITVGFDIVTPADRNLGRRHERGRANRNDVLTHVDFVLHTVVDDFEQSDDMSVSALLHDSNFFPNLVLGGSHSIGQRHMGGFLDGTLPQELHLVLGSLPFHSLDCLLKKS
jgi:hypothetical protein